MVIYNNKSETQQVAPGTLAHPTKWQGVYNGLSTYLHSNILELAYTSSEKCQKMAYKWYNR